MNGGGASSTRLVSGLRRLATKQPGGGPGGEGGSGARDGERCDLCGKELVSEHRHLLHLVERRIDCSCETCWSVNSGNPEYRPVGTRVEWLEDFRMSDEQWASFSIPIGLAFFMRSSVADGVVALYPSPAGATESELELGSWDSLVESNPKLAEMETDAEGLVVNRMSDTPQYAIAPIDSCYMLVGLVKSKWEGISGGTGLEKAISGYFEDLRTRAGAAAA